MRSASRGNGPVPKALDAKVEGITKIMKKEFNLPSFKITPNESCILSLPQRTEKRNEALASLLQGVEHPATIVEGYAGVGGDTLSFAKMAGDRGLILDMFAVQKSPKDEGDDKGRFARLETHVGLYFKHNVAAKLSAKVTLFNKPVQDFIRKDFPPKVDLLYLDPPWNLPEDFDLATNRGTDKKPSIATITYIDRIQSEVFGPLLAGQRPRPKYVCLKAPTPFIEFSIALFDASPFARGYTLLASIPFRDKRGAIRLYYHILENTDERKAATPAMLNPSAQAFVPGAF